MSSHYSITTPPDLCDNKQDHGESTDMEKAIYTQNLTFFPLTVERWDDFTTSVSYTHLTLPTIYSV